MVSRTPLRPQSKNWQSAAYCLHQIKRRHQRMCSPVRPKIRGLRRLARKCHFLSLSNWAAPGAFLSMLRGQGRQPLIISASHGAPYNFRCPPNSRHSLALQYLSQRANNGLSRCKKSRGNLITASAAGGQSCPALQASALLSDRAGHASRNPAAISADFYQSSLQGDCE